MFWTKISLKTFKVSHTNEKQKISKILKNLDIFLEIFNIFKSKLSSNH